MDRKVLISCIINVIIYSIVGGNAGWFTSVMIYK